MSISPRTPPTVKYTQDLKKKPQGPKKEQAKKNTGNKEWPLEKE